MKIALIGQGAIAGYVSRALPEQGHSLGAVLVRSSRVAENPTLFGGSVETLPDDIDVVIDCAGHAALAAYGPDVLRRGMDLITVSLGALAKAELYENLEHAAQEGGAKLHLASGAIGALDCLQAAQIGPLSRVTYVGRKPPVGWKGSPAEDHFELDRIESGAHVHFDGTARAAALAYPKNANVAAAVALAGIGFDATNVRLIADADLTQNIHEIEAVGEFGNFTFRISGQALPENPRSSALAAMSVLSKLAQLNQPIGF